MPVIPITSRTDPRFVDTSPQLTMPSESQLLMALAEMNNLGRFTQLPKSTNIEDVRPGNPRQAEVRNNMLANIRDQAEDANDRSDAFQDMTIAGGLAAIVNARNQRRSREAQR